jgi:hypothetical protein
MKVMASPLSHAWRSASKRLEVSKQNSGRLGDSNRDVSIHGHGAVAVLAGLPCSIAEQRSHEDGKTHFPLHQASSASSQPTFLSQPCRSAFGNRRASCRAYMGLHQLDVRDPVPHHISRHPQSMLSPTRHSFPFPVLQFQLAFPSISVCLGIRTTRATPQEHRFEVCDSRTRPIYLRELHSKRRANCGPETVWRWRRDGMILARRWTPSWASRWFGVNLDLGWAFAPALVEAWYVGNFVPPPWESDDAAFGLFVSLRRECSVAAVLVDVGSSPTSSCILPVARRHAACGAIRLGLVNWGWDLLRFRPRFWGRSAIDWSRAIPSSGRFKTDARSQKLSRKTRQTMRDMVSPLRSLYVSINIGSR